MAETRGVIDELRASYDAGNLRYVVGSASSAPGDARSVDRALLSQYFARDEELRHLCDEDAALDGVGRAFERRFGEGAVAAWVHDRLAAASSSPEQAEELIFELVRRATYPAQRERAPDPIHHELAAAILDPKYERKARLLTLQSSDQLEAALSAAGARDVRVVAEPDSLAQGHTPEVVHLQGHVPRSGPARGLLGSDGRAPGHSPWADAVLANLLAGPERTDVLLVSVGIADPWLQELVGLRARLGERLPVARMFALVSSGKCVPPAETALERFGERLASEWEPSRWRALQIEPLVIDDPELLPHALRRVRLGVDPARWAKRSSQWLASKGAYLELYSEKRQRASHGLMRSMMRHLRSRFAIAREEEVHIGVHVPAEDDPRSLRIAFHFVGEQEGVSLLPNLLTEASARQRELSIGGPGEPEGATGSAFVTGKVVRSHVGDQKLHENFPPEKADRWQGPRTFQSLLAVPAYEIEAGHLPVGVMYLNSNRRRPFWSDLDPDDYRDLCAFCSRMCVSMLRAG